MTAVTASRQPRRLAHIGGLALLAGSVILMAVVVFPQLVGASGSYIVLSGSMSPTIHPGDVVVSRHVEPSAIEEGDVIVFENGGDTQPDRTTHRVVDVIHRDGGLYFKTKGDANEEPDSSLVSADHVTGRVWFHVPYMGRLLMFARTKTGLLSLVILPCLLLVVTETYSLVKAARASAPDDDEEATRNSSESAEESAQTNQEDR